MSAVKRKRWKYRFEDREEGLKLWLLRMKKQTDQGNIPDYQTVKPMPWSHYGVSSQD